MPLSRAAILTLGSLVVSAICIGHSWSLKQQFYPTVVHLSHSNIAIMALCNLAIMTLLGFGKMMAWIFFGELRLGELEILYERTWYAVTETLLAMTVFRDEFNRNFVILFAFLLFNKVFHWITQERVDKMEHAPSIPKTFHLRMLTVMSTLGLIDSAMIMVAYNVTKSHGPSMQLLFGFEYLVLITFNTCTFIKYLLHTIDLRSQENWDNKRLYMYYVELIGDLIKFVGYITFFGVILHFYSFPFHIMRELYLTFRTFMKRIKDFVQYRRATANMNERYSDATAEELAAADHICIICRETMNEGKKLPCNHVFHRQCLRSWLEQQPHCPTCRRSVLEPAPLRPPAGAAAAPGAPQAGAAAMAGGEGLPPGAIPLNQLLPPHMLMMWALANGQVDGVGGAAAGGDHQPSTSQPDTRTASVHASRVQTPLLGPGGYNPFLFPQQASQRVATAPVEEEDLSQLTDEQLIALQGQERANIENRIQYLRKLNRQINALLAQYQQFEETVPKMNEQPRPQQQEPHHGEGHLHQE